MAGLVTKETTRSVIDFIDRLENSSKREDSKELVSLIQEVSGEKAKIWGNEKNPDFIIGFGKYTYQRRGKKEEYEWFPVGFAPRKTKLTIYVSFDLNQEEELLKKLGKSSWGKGCLHINKLADVDLEILRLLIAKSKGN